MNQKNSNQCGITLIELMIVVGVLSILATIAIPSFYGYIAESRIAECRNEVAAIRLAEEELFLSTNAYIAGTLDGPAGVTTLVNNLAGIYTPSATANSINSNCSYTVVVGAGGCGAVPPPPGALYSICATGLNQLAGRGVVVNVSGP